MNRHAPQVIPNHCAATLHRRYPRFALLALAIALPGLGKAEIRIAGSEQQIGSSNGVPVIGIANPNDKGLSHNRFEQFNVDRNGVIFNNSLAAGSSQLGGWLNANANLSRAAKVILSEVTGNQASTLAGALEVFGAKADVIVANPNGITLNGVKTLNTRGFVATTGTPNLNDALLLEVQHDSGRVVVGARGVDTQGLSYFDIVARTVALNGRVGATNASADIQILAGLNRYDGEQRTYERLHSSAANAPDIAIDGSVAGAMYGRNINLISSESAVGVRQAGLIHSAEDIHIQANGDIELSSVHAGGNITLDTTGDVITSGQKADAGIWAGRDVQLKARHIELGAATQSSRFVAEATSLKLNGSTLKTTANDPASAALSINVDDLIVDGAMFAYNDSLALAKRVLFQQGRLVILLDSGRAEQNAELTSTARIESAGGININAKHLQNRQGIIENQGDHGVKITAGVMVNQGMLRSDAAIDITTTVFDNRCIENQAQMVCAGILSNSAATVKADSFRNQAGLVAEGNMTLLLGDGKHTNAQRAEIYAGNDLLITRGAPGIDSILSSSGQIIAGNDARIIQNGFDNYGWGLVQAGRDLNLKSYSAFTNSARMSARQKMTIASQAIKMNANAHVSAGDLSLQAASSFSSEKGSTLLSNGNLTLTSGTDMHLGSYIDSRNNLTVHADGNLTNTGTILNDGNTGISSERTITNRDGLIWGGYLTVTAKNDIINSQSVLAGRQSVVLHTPGSVLNDDSSIIDGENVAINAALLLNQMKSTIAAWSSLQFNVKAMRNTSGATLMLNEEILEQAEPAYRAL